MKHHLKTTETGAEKESQKSNADFRETLGEPTLRETADDLYEVVSGQLKTFEEEFMRARSFVQKNPVISILAATIVGYYLGKLFRKKKIVYVEKSKT